MLSHRGYTGIAEIDWESGTIHGRLAGLQDVVTFQATTPDGLAEEFRRSVDDYLAMCTERGEDPERPNSGRLDVRVSPEVHRKLAALAEARGVSLNEAVAAAIGAAVGSEIGAAELDRES